MRSCTLRAVITAVLLIAGTQVAISQKVVKKELFVYNWYEYFGSDTIKSFQESTKIRVQYDTFGSNEILETKMLTGRSGYDLVFPAVNFFARQKRANVYQPIELPKLKNLENVDPVFWEILEDFGLRQHDAIPYAWGTVGIAVNAEKLAVIAPDAPINSLELFMNPVWLSKISQCGVFVLDSPIQVTSIILNAIGLDPNSEELTELDRVFKILEQIRPFVTHFSNERIISDLASGEICAALTYSGDAWIAMNKADSASGLEYSIPLEGTEIFLDVMAIPKDAKNVVEAHAFIDHILKPETAANITDTVFFPTANKEAKRFLRSEVRENPSIYPPKEILDSLFVTTPYSIEYTRKLTRYWTRFKTGT